MAFIVLVVVGLSIFISLGWVREWWQEGGECARSCFNIKVSYKWTICLSDMCATGNRYIKYRISRI